jgi:hypothetical protein
MKHKLVFTLNPETKEISYEFQFENPKTFFEKIESFFDAHEFFEKSYVLSDEEQTQLRFVLDQRSKLVSQEKFAKFKAKYDEIETDGSMVRWFEKRQRQEKIYDKRLERFHQTCGIFTDKLNETIAKIKTKYDSVDYINKEWRARREPMTCLYNFLLEYARKNGSKNQNMLRQPFAHESYNIGNYNITLFCGQGSFIRVDLLTDIENDNEKFDDEYIRIY